MTQQQDIPLEKLITQKFDFSPLRDVAESTDGARFMCHGSCSFFCPTCFRLDPRLEGRVPRVRLPFKLDVLIHKDRASKLSGIAAAALAPQDVRVLHFPRDVPKDLYCLPGEGGYGKTVLLYPASSFVATAFALKGSKAPCSLTGSLHCVPRRTERQSPQVRHRGHSPRHRRRRCLRGDEVRLFAPAV